MSRGCRETKTDPVFHFQTILNKTRWLRAGRETAKSTKNDQFEDEIVTFQIDWSKSVPDYLLGSLLENTSWSWAHK